ncbi:MAG: hypothetical protein QG597_2635, partial [Actinomycetota bacterium]|nr:hypothetical protein [Actinomycetota bacterium]
MSLADVHPPSGTAGDPEPLPPPSWARSHGPDSGGIAHETNVYLVPKAIRHLDVNRDELVPVQVSMSVIDRR